MKKVWICLYTCCVVRAIHLDLVPDQTTPAFLRSFRRYVARRGVPRQVVSDNGKTFKAAAKALRDVKWVFNIPKAPWWGGVFERLVRCIKRCLRKMVGQAKLSADELLTVLLEVEMVLNSRPLTVVSAEDVEEPLTPSHLIVGQRIMSDVEMWCVRMMTNLHSLPVMTLLDEQGTSSSLLTSFGRDGEKNIWWVSVRCTVITRRSPTPPELQWEMLWSYTVTSKQEGNGSWAEWRSCWLVLTVSTGQQLYE